MGTNSINADGVAVHYGTRTTTGESTSPRGFNVETRRGWVDYFQDFLTLEADFTSGLVDMGATGAGTANSKVLSSAPNGVVTLVTGSTAATPITEGSEYLWASPIYCSNGGVSVECRLRINGTDSAITNQRIGFGLNGTVTVGPTSTAPTSMWSIAATAITFTGTDSCMFTYDSNATTGQWYCLSLKGTVISAQNGLSGVAPVHGTYQTLRIEIDKDGDRAEFFINGTKVKETLLSITPSVPLHPCVYVIATAAGVARRLDVDYMHFSYARS